ncbi:MAG: TPM domain-containing protein [Oscillospiraceae bacterium]|nr:TPM domain-containing protein [Oscillospiraceae bacterium]
MVRPVDYDLIMEGTYVLSEDSLGYLYDSTLPYVSDVAELLTDRQRLELDDRSADMSDKYRCDVRIVTVNDMEEFGYSDIKQFSYRIYTEYDLGYGRGKNCVLFVLSMADRDYDLRVWGDYAQTAFTLYGIDNALDNHILPYLRNNDYNKALSAYLDRSELYLKMADEGKPFDRKTDPATQRTTLLVKLGVAVLLPLLVAAVVCLIWRGQMKTARIARLADNYIPEGGFRLTGYGDVFLFRTTTHTRITSSNSSSGGGGASGGGPGGSVGRSGKF